MTLEVYPTGRSGHLWVDCDGEAIGSLLFEDGRLTLHIVAEAHAPAEWVSANDLRQLAQYMDQIEDALK